MSVTNRLVPLCALVALSLGCSWARFDDVTDNPPVERLKAPSSTSSLGLSLAAHTGAMGSSLVAAASDRIVLYDLGSGTTPSTTATASQSCVGDNSCVLARGLASLKSPALTNDIGCVAYGMGMLTESSGTVSGKLWLFCDGAERRSLDLPASMQTWLSNRALTNETALYLGAPHSISALVAAAPEASLAWFYPSSSPFAFELPSLPDGKKPGRAVAVIPHDTGYAVLVSSMTTDELWLYAVDSTPSATLTGCIQGPAQFGRLLSTGNFDGDGIDDLLVADGTTVYAIAGSSLVTFSASSITECTSVASLQLLATASCANLKDVIGCNSQPFASAITSANLDGTGTDELVIGVAEAVVRGESAAGAVLAYTLENGTFVVKEGLFVSSAAGGDRLGTSVAAVPAGNLERIAAGAPGDNSVMEFFCNSLVPAESKAARCP